MFKQIPTYINGIWSFTEFQTQKDYIEFLKSKIKKPGSYELKGTHLFRQAAIKYQQTGNFTDKIYKSKDWIDFWNFEKTKSWNGVIINDFFLTGHYYFYLNYCPIYNVLEQSVEHPEVWDSHYDYTLHAEIAKNTGKHLVLTKKRRWGLSQPVHLFLDTPTGKRRFGDLKVGDKVYNKFGKPTNIIAIHPQGVIDTYKITFIDGRSTLCSEHHLWDLRKTKSLKNTVKNTGEIINDLYGKSKTDGKEYKSYKWSIPLQQPIEREEKNFIITPYTLGALIGDGCLTNNIRFISMDNQMFDEILKEVGEDYEWGYEETNVYKDRLSKATRKVLKLKVNAFKNPLIQEVKKLGLIKSNCYNKFIPKDYLNSSIKQRKDLLAGLIDTDGHVIKNQIAYEYSTVSKQLFLDVIDLCNSLGYKTTCRKVKGKRINESDIYKIRFTTTDILPRLNRKIENFKVNLNVVKKDSSFRNNFVAIKSIEKLSEKTEQMCISVDCPTQTYLTNDYIVTHNSLIECSDIHRQFIFKNKAILRLVHKDDDVNEKNYRILVDYRMFTDKHTGWHRPVMGDSKCLYQRIEETDLIKKSKSYIGTESIIECVCTAKNPAKGVGGQLTKGFYDEAGTNDMLIKSIQYAEKSIKQGGVIKGQIIAAGSVGELKQSEDLKELIYNPVTYGFYAVYNEDTGTKTGLFYPESVNYVEALYDEDDNQIGHKKHYDSDGNSNIETAIKAILANRLSKKSKSPEAYRLSVSQEPLTLDECFNERVENIFPTHIIQPRYDKLYQNKDKVVAFCLLKKEDDKIKIEWVDKKRKILDMPIKKETDLRGCCVIYEYPMQNAPTGLYYAGIDPVSNKSTTIITSSSVMTCYIIKAENMINGEYTKREIVAEFAGRYDDYEETYKQVTNLCYFYNARMLVENNVGSYITWLLQNKTEYKGITFKMIQNTEMSNLKDITPNFSASASYGVTVGPKIRNYLLEQCAAYIENPINKMFNEHTGEETIIRGIDNFPDHMCLLEMLKYTDKLNVDRLIALGLAIWAEQILCQKNNFIIKRKEQKEEIIVNKSQFSNNYRFGKSSYFRK